MGTSNSKPLPSRNSAVMDSIILCDDLLQLKSNDENAFKKPAFAGSATGRFLFILGDKQTKAVGDAGSELVTYFQLDVIDVFLSRRVRIKHVGDFYDFGQMTGFYALNERTVVIVDYNMCDGTLRQRLTEIDLGKETATCNLHRGYASGHLAISLLDFPSCIFPGFINARTIAGKELAVTVFPNREHERIMYPINPLTNRPHADMTEMIEEANLHVMQYYPPGEMGEARVSTSHPPFFISNTKLGFFIDQRNLAEAVDPMSILEMDLDSGTVRIREASSSPAFPLADGITQPFFANWTQSNSGEVVLMYRYQRPAWCWQTAVEWLMLQINRPYAYLVDVCRRRGYWRLEFICRLVSTVNFATRWCILQTQPTDLAILNPRTLNWTEIKESIVHGETIVPLANGHFIIASSSQLNEPIDPEASRAIGAGPAKKAREQFRLIRNPHRLPSLGHLSSIQVQKYSGRIPRDILEQIAARML